MRAPRSAQCLAGVPARASIGALLLLGCWLLLAPKAVADAAADVTVQAAPASVGLRPGDGVLVRLIVTDAAPEAAVLTGIHFVGSPDVAAALVGTVLPADVAPGTALPISVALRAGPGVHDGELAAVATYRTASSPTARVAVASLTVKGVDPRLPEIALVDMPDRLNDGEHRAALVRISNQTGTNYRDVALSALGADDVTIVATGTPPPPFVACGAGRASSGRSPIVCLPRLASGESALLPVLVSANPSVRTGTEQVGVALAATADVPAAPPAILVTATGTVQLAVFGVDALSPFGVGTLFVLPGLVTVLVVLLLARAIYPRASSLPDTIDLKDLRAMPFVVPAAALAYLAIWLVWGHNLTRTVSTADVGALFTIAVVLALLVWGALALAWWLHSGRKTFAAGDDVARVLKRLDARQARLTLPRFTVSNVPYFLLTRSGDGKVLAAPAISYHFTARVTDDAARRAAVQLAIQHDNTATVVHAQRRNEIAVRWNTPTGVSEFDAKDVAVAGEGPLLTEEQADA